MNKNFVLFRVAIMAAGVSFSGCGRTGHAVSSSDTEAVVKTADLEVRFRRTEPWSETYMIFGGTAIDQKNAVNNVTLVGLDLDDARRIHSRYPDFHRCSSPGARSAQSLTVQLNLVPSDSVVLDELRAALSDHEASLQSGGDRVCVRVEGAVLELESVRLREDGTDITSQTPFKRFDYFLVTFAERVDSADALGGP